MSNLRDKTADTNQSEDRAAAATNPPSLPLQQNNAGSRPSGEGQDSTGDAISVQNAMQVLKAHCIAHTKELSYQVNPLPRTLLNQREERPTDRQTETETEVQPGDKAARRLGRWVLGLG
eukprot:9386-Rhodomonas_salina.2